MAGIEKLKLGESTAFIVQKINQAIDSINNSGFTSSTVGSPTQPIYLADGVATPCTYTLGKSVPADAVFTDTKNTAGSTDSSSKLFLIGATSQAANPQTYSHDTAYVGTNGKLYSGGKVVYASGDTIPEAYLTWGGRNSVGSYAPIDAAMIPALGANRLAFMPASGITIEYSQDGGTTWTEYSTTDAGKINLFNGNGTSYYIGGSTATKIDKSAYMLRVTIETDAAKVYTILNKFAIYISTNGSTGCYCTITGRTQANYTAGTDTWNTFVDKQSISGWSGWNIINTSLTTYGNQSTHYRQVRFTFGVTSHENTLTYAGLTVTKILGFGGVGWETPSTLAATGNMFSYDYLQNVTFPSGVSAKSFTENGTALSDKYQAKLTYTPATQDVATTSKAGLMSASDKTKLDGLSNYSLPIANSSTLGGIKTGYSTSGKNYKVNVDTNGNAYVNVPWTNEDSEARSTANEAHLLAQTAYNIAEGKSEAYVFENLQDMFETILQGYNAGLEDGELSYPLAIGTSLYLKEEGTPDYWICAHLEENKTTAEPTGPEIEDTGIYKNYHIGYYEIQNLESDKVDLNGYAQTTGTYPNLTAGKANAVSWSDVTGKPSLVTLDTTQTITGAKTYTGNQTFKNNYFEVKANSNTDDSWIKMTNSTDAGYYAFGIRRPYSSYGLQMKYHPADNSGDKYYKIWNEDNDGEGSNLDADKLDGQQGSYYTGYTDTAIAGLSSVYQPKGNYLGVSEKAQSAVVADSASAVHWDNVTNKPSSYYTLPTASNSTLGGVKTGSNITNTSGTISLTKSNVTTALSYTPVSKSGDTLSDNATLKFSTYGTRFITISGNSISADMSNEIGGWAGNFASVKDPSGATTSMLGWYGGATGLTHIYMGGTYSDPFMKFTTDGQFTFKKTPKVGTTSLATTSDVSTAISNLVNSAPDALNTLKELSTALGDDPNFAATVAKQIGGKLGKTEKAADSDKLDGQDGSYYLNYNNLTNKPAIPSAYSLPLAASGTRGGIQIGYTASGANIPLQLSSEKAYVALTSSAVTSALTYTPANDTAVVKLAGAQTITGDKITTGTFTIRNGSASGAFVLGADVNAKTLTANTRKLGRMGVPSYDSTTKTVAGISFDSQVNANYADFGGHPNNASSIAPDVIRFVVANAHNNSVSGTRTLALQISKQAGLSDTAGGGSSVAGAKFFVPVIVDGNISATSITENGTALENKYQAKGNYLTGITKSQVTTALGYTPAAQDVATTSKAGLMSAADKTKLDGITGGGASVEVVDVQQILMTQDATTLKSLSQRYINGEITMVASMESSYGVVTGVNYISENELEWTITVPSVSIPDSPGLVELNHAYLDVYFLRYNGTYITLGLGRYTLPKGIATNLTDGLMSASDKAKLNGLSNYSLPVASSSTRGGIKIGYSASGANVPVQLSSEKAYVALTKSAVTSALGYTPPTTNDISTAISNLVDSSPDALNTLNELAAALGDDPNFATTVTNNLAGKLDKSGGTTTGLITLPYDKSSLRFGAASASQGYYWDTYYRSNGDEGLVFSGGNNKVSFVIRNDAKTSWNDSGAAFHVKNNTVAINKTITGASASYTLDVNGAIGGTTLYENGTSLSEKYQAKLGYTPLSTDGGTIEGDLTLHATSGDSPKLRFQRGDNTGTLTDWNINVVSGALNFNTVATSGATTETTIVSIGYSGGMNVVGGLKEDGVALSSKYQAKGNYLTGITKSQVTTALGYTPPSSLSDLSITASATEINKLKGIGNIVQSDQAMTIKWSGSLSSASWLLAWADSGSTIQGIAPSSLTVKRATTAGSADSVAWANVADKPTIPKQYRHTIRVAITHNSITLVGAISFVDSRSTAYTLSDANTKYNAVPFPFTATNGTAQTFVGMAEFSSASMLKITGIRNSNGTISGLSLAQAGINQLLAATATEV